MGEAIQQERHNAEYLRSLLAELQTAGRTPRSVETPFGLGRSVKRPAQLILPRVARYKEGVGEFSETVQLAMEVCHFERVLPDPRKVLQAEVPIAVDLRVVQPRRELSLLPAIAGK